MKKFNVNIILFVLVFLFILAGFSVKYFNSLKHRISNFLLRDIPSGQTEILDGFFTDIDDISTKSLRYRTQLLDLNSAKGNLSNEKLAVKNDMTVFKTEEESLLEERPEITLEDIDPAIEKLTQLQQCAQENGADFLYIAAPEKGTNLTIPANATNYSAENYALFMEALEDAQIPTLNLSQEMELAGLLNKDAFFYTDHHWKPEIGFWANGKICEALQNRYDFVYDDATTDIGNYNVKVYEDWFLGSYGKKVGLHFSSEGADDITLITPSFDTDLTESIPYDNHLRTGSFTETMLYLEKLVEKDYYGQNPYAAYGGGNFRLQILKNNLLSEGKKIVILRDSFAYVVAPYLALSCAEVHCIDVRDLITTEDINVYDYIEEIKPDYVLVLYNGAVTEEYARINFG